MDSLASVKVPAIGYGSRVISKLLSLGGKCLVTANHGNCVGHFGNPVDQHTLHFVKEFGLMLFVFTIGLQLGPGFAAALRDQGGKLNLLAATI